MAADAGQRSSAAEMRAPPKRAHYVLGVPGVGCLFLFFFFFEPPPQNLVAKVRSHTRSDGFAVVHGECVRGGPEGVRVDGRRPGPAWDVAGRRDAVARPRSGNRGRWSPRR